MRSARREAKGRYAINVTTVIQAVILGLATGCTFALLAGGMTMIYAVTKTMFTAHGDILSISMYIAFSLYAVWRLDPYVSVLITAPAMFVIGLVFFRILMKPVIKESPLVFFQIGLAAMFVIEEVLRVIYTVDYKTVPSFIGLDKLHAGPIIIRTTQLVAFLGAIVVSLSFYWMLQKTDLGRSIRAVAEKPDAARLMGINVVRVQMVVFALGFVLCAIAGALVLPFTTLEPYVGLGFVLYAIIVLTMGTMGNFLGALLAGMIIGIATSMSSLLWGSSMSGAIPYILFVLVLIFLPRGFFGARSAR